MLLVLATLGAFFAASLDAILIDNPCADSGFCPAPPLAVQTTLGGAMMLALVVLAAVGAVAVPVLLHRGRSAFWASALVTGGMSLVLLVCFVVGKAATPSG